MLINGVIFNNEIELLKFRLDYYKGIVDHFVFLESNKTFSGQNKDILSGSKTEDAIRASFTNFTFVQLDKGEISESDYEQRWPVELESRRQLLSYVTDRFDNDIVFLTDADEFPSINQLEKSKECVSNDTKMFGSLTLKTSYTFANWTLKDKFHKNFSGITVHSTLSKNDVRISRNAGRHGNFPLIEGEPGIHLSYLGYSDIDVKGKFASFSHSEFDKNLPINQIVELANVYAVDHLGRFWNRFFGILHVEPIDSLNSVQMAVHIKNPELLKFHYSKNLLLRLYASLAITKMIESPHWFRVDYKIFEGRLSMRSILYLISQIFLRFWISMKYRFREIRRVLKVRV